MANRAHQQDFDTIAEAISYLAANAASQPSLEALARHLRLSPSHTQRLFTAWAGTSPKKFLQYMSIERAKRLLAEDRASVLGASVAAGLSGPSRLHDLFVTIEGMTPGEYKNGGMDLSITYRFAETPFGTILIASTGKGIAYLAFADDETGALAELTGMFPNAAFARGSDPMHERALRIFSDDWTNPEEIRLHLRGTDFQLKVWNALLTIPPGRLSTYGAIAARIAHPRASRAVGTAVGQNPVSFVIPCHRVIQASGILGNYHWSPARKAAMIGWEASRADAASE